MMEAIETLLTPVSPEHPCGESVRYSPEFDRLAAARQQDDETLPTGVWQSTPRRADWEEVARLACELTLSRSKDLVIMSWLGEAWLHLRGLLALPDALSLLALALERYPNELHPQIKDDDYDYRAAPLCWVAQHYAAMVANAPLFTCEEETISLAQWQQGKRHDLPPSEMQANIGLALTASLKWLQRLTELCQNWPDATAPSFNVLEQKIKTCQQALGHSVTERPQSEAGETQISAATNSPAFASREEAYQMLKQIADYLQRTEPHSPVPYLLHRACIWGHTPLPELLNELLVSDEAARQLWRQLGVLP
ncbi:type VI secretion system protein TssA [Salmonella bongori]|nr:type VI secretion system protein TssA [Salmonella bongori]